MKLQQVKTWTFDELTEEQQEKAVQRYCDINVDYEWYEWIYEDAKCAGITITVFDIDRGTIKAKVLYPEDTAKHILADHGKRCDTFATALEYTRSRKGLVAQYADSTGEVAEDNEPDFEQDCEDLDAEFARSIAGDYLVLLRREHENLTSSAAIAETLRINECYFTEDGKIF